jgi:hypothetical protein
MSASAINKKTQNYKFGFSGTKAAHNVAIILKTNTDAYN